MNAIALDAIYRAHARRVLATLIRLLGGFDEAEESLHDAFVAAAAEWPVRGVPDNPYAWLVSTGRFKAIDRLRRRARLEGAMPELVRQAEPEPDPDSVIADDELRLVFTCCHPALPPDARIALTLREVCGLTTEEIARAYLVTAPTIAQRIVRAKAKIRDERLPYELPDRGELPARVESALSVVYLIFNEGYAATQGPCLVRDDLCREALRLGRLLMQLTGDAEALGLVALMLLHESRRHARVDTHGDLVLLEEQDRSRWDRELVAEAQALLDQALRARRVGPYVLQAAIAAVHAEAPNVDVTDWVQIVGLYDVLRIVSPSAIVVLNRAAAIAMRDGAAAGLVAVDAALHGGELDEYCLAHAARADLQRRLGRNAEARGSYERALALTAQPAQQRFFRGRLAALPD